MQEFARRYCPAVSQHHGAKNRNGILRPSAEGLIVSAPTTRISFGVFELDTESGELRRRGIRVNLQDQPCQLLQLLLEHPGHVVTREALRARLWPADTFVDFEHGLNRAVHRLREVLRDCAESPRFIETLPRRGYRFIAPVQSPIAPARFPTTDLAVGSTAREAYLAGRFFRQTWTCDGLAKSETLLRQSLALAPGFADGHAALSQTYCSMGILGCRPAHEVYPSARAAALNALQIDDSVADAHLSLAEVKKAYEWDWAAAETGYRRALALDATNSLTHVWYADWLSKMGRHSEAIDAALRARELDPVSADRNSFLGFIFYRARQYDQALAMCRKAIELVPYYPPSHWFIGLVYQQLGEHRLAIAALQHAVRYSGTDPPHVALLGHAYGTAGESAQAARIIEWLACASRSRYVSPMDLAIAHLGARDHDSAFQWLEKAYLARTMRIQELGQPIFDVLRNDPRYADLLRRLGLGHAS
jgi:DNA-binding winged helix-turn-helix (wHTH) protein/Tfp pilus assembly protein PilF